ncbi:MAG TPA: hypothetical protein VNG51_00410 [Ktedonobacteraceae bacterium]|nr:hypothetical protein [Ktedonobacteraceae bacterium]
MPRRIRAAHRVARSFLPPSPLITGPAAAPSRIMNTKTAAAIAALQSTLWQDETDGAIPRQERHIYLGDTLALVFAWADGDVSPPALERLARLRLGDLEYHQDIQGRYHPFRVRSTRIIAGVGVQGICEAILNPLNGKNSCAEGEAIEDEAERAEVQP